MADLRLTFSEVKLCTRCGCVLLRECFAKHRNQADGLCGWCRRCNQEYRKQYRKDHPDRIADYFLKHYYGLTHDQRELMECTCQGRCMICGKPETHTNQYGVRKLSVDHNHVTSTVRGLLGSKCNQALGLLYVDEMGTELLQRAIEYVRTKDGRLAS